MKVLGKAFMKYVKWFFNKLHKEETAEMALFQKYKVFF